MIVNHTWLIYGDQELADVMHEDGTMLGVVKKPDEVVEAGFFERLHDAWYVLIGHANAIYWYK